jgi:4-hydroxy-3-polyprenylbenzoate decarboxylase
MAPVAITLRDWLQKLEDRELLHRVTSEVHIGEVADIVDRNYQGATLFEHIRDYAFPLAANTFSNRKMMAVALETEEDRILEALEERMRRRVQPILAPTSPCKEVIEKGRGVNLAGFPLHLQHQFDGAPYISASVVVAKDPDRHVTNLGVYRMMFRSKSETGVDVSAPHKLRAYYQRACELGKPLEVAAVLGLPAIDVLAAEVSAPLDQDELEVLGGFRGQPAELVQCETVDLAVPANAEIVLEGEMPPTGWTEDEGPYGEFTGTYGGFRRNPVIKIKAITRRRDAIFLSATHGGLHPGWTDLHVIFPIIELDIYQALRQAGIDVRAVRLHPGSSGMWATTSIKPLSKGDSKNALAIMLSASRQAFPKYAVVVNDDIDIYDDERVYWAMTWRTQANQDVMILNDMKAVPLDPSLPAEVPPVATSKMGFDATIPFDKPSKRFEVCRPASLEYRKVSPSEVSEDEIDQEILGLISNGPAYFYEILETFGSRGQRHVLESMGRLRERGVFERDEVGRYKARK